MGSPGGSCNGLAGGSRAGGAGGSRSGSGGSCLGAFGFWAIETFLSAPEPGQCRAERTVPYMLGSPAMFEATSPIAARMQAIAVDTGFSVSDRSSSRLRNVLVAAGASTSKTTLVNSLWRRSPFGRPRPHAGWKEPRSGPSLQPARDVTTGTTSERG